MAQPGQLQALPWMMCADEEGPGAARHEEFLNRLSGRKIAFLDDCRLRYCTVLLLAYAASMAVLNLCHQPVKVDGFCSGMSCSTSQKALTDDRCARAGFSTLSWPTTSHTASAQPSPARATSSAQWCASVELDAWHRVVHCSSSLWYWFFFIFFIAPLSHCGCAASRNIGRVLTSVQWPCFHRAGCWRAWHL
jgi:hypothetical protein